MSSREAAVKWFTAVVPKTLGNASRGLAGVNQQKERSGVPPEARGRRGRTRVRLAGRGEAAYAAMAAGSPCAAALRVLPARDGGWQRPHT